MNIKSKAGLLSQPKNTTGFIMHKDPLTSAMAAGLQMVQEGEVKNFLISRDENDIVLSIGDDLNSLNSIHREANDSFKNFITEGIQGGLFLRYISDYYGENFGRVNDFIELTAVEAAYILLRASQENPDDIRFSVLVNESEDQDDHAWAIVTLDDLDIINNDKAKWMVSGETDVPSAYLINFTDKLGDEDDYNTLLLNECRELIRFNPDVEFEFENYEGDEEPYEESSDHVDEVIKEIVDETATVVNPEHTVETIVKVINTEDEEENNEEYTDDEER